MIASSRIKCLNFTLNGPYISQEGIKASIVSLKCYLSTLSIVLATRYIIIKLSTVKGEVINR